MKFSNIQSFLPLILILWISASCAQFRVEELSPSLIFSTEISHPGSKNPDGKIQAMENRRVAYNFPVKPVTDGSNFYIIDPENHLVRVFSNNGELKKIIGKEGSMVPEGVDHVKIDVGIPGWIAVDDSGNVYIQKRKNEQKENNKEGSLPVNPENEVYGSLSTRSFTPSSILILDDSDELNGEIGEEGSQSELFPIIYRMDALNDEILHVLHLYKGEKTLSSYQEGKLKYRITAFNPSDEKENKRYHVEIEDIIPHQDNQYAMASIAYRDKKSFEFNYRKIYHIHFQTNSYEEIAWLDEPDDHFGWIREDGGFYLIHTDEDGSRVRFRIYSNTGEHINNLQITFSGVRSSWRETYMTLEENIYTSRIYKDRFEFYEWQ